MKKLFVTILAVFYLSVSSGATMHFHYCMGQLIKWGLDFKEPSACSKCGMEISKSKSCCKDQIQQLKVDTSQRLSDNSVQLQVFSTALPVTPYSELYKALAFSIPEELPVSNAPPDQQPVPVFLRFCNFRI